MSPILGVLLAGGQSRRMGGGDKNLRELSGRPILSHVIERAQAQVDCLIINANGDPGRFKDYNLTIVSDSIGGFQGPLAGILTGMEWAVKNVPDAEWVMTFATDAPFFPSDLVSKLITAVTTEYVDGQEGGQADIACATSGKRSHPVFALWPVRLKDDLRHALTVEEIRKIDLWTNRYRVAAVDFSTHPFDPFFNINRPEDLEEAQVILEACK